jgi:P27 family predicted phage terminase small subunit
MAKPSLKVVRAASVPTTPQPPKHLTSEGQAEWRQFQTDYSIIDPAGLALLTMFAESQDRIRAAQAIIKRDGITIKDKWGKPHKNPAILVEERARSAVLRCLKQLELVAGRP